jgi:hypothetical protein
MGEGRASNPLVQQFRQGGIPRDLRVLAAQGALPLTPADLVELLHHLLGDPEADIQQAAAKTLMEFPAAEMLPILKDRETLPAVLSWGLTHREEKELREVVLQNVSLPDEAVEAIVASLPEALAELVVINQVRLLRRTSLLEALETNPQLSNDQKRRLRELRETFRIGEEAAPPPPPPPPPPPGPEEVLPPIMPEELVETATISEAEAMVRYLSEEERNQGEKVSVLQRVYRLNTADKVITALKGSREERAILVRDPNRIVSTAVLGSPRLTEAEVESFAAMKNVADTVLRAIGTNKDWTKRYGVISSLVRNPRTPLAISLGMVSRLNPRDIKAIAVDRNVPEVIRRQAQKFIKGQQQGPPKR